MRGDDELAACLDKLIDPNEQRELSLRRQRGLRLVQDVEAIVVELVDRNSEECYSVAASAWPAWQASRGDPVRALRSE